MLDITATLRMLNTYAIGHNISLVYHDFSGRNVRLVAELFDKELANHLDHIMYDISVRANHGCFFDLTRLDIPYFITGLPGKRAMVKMLNIFVPDIAKDHLHYPNGLRAFEWQSQELCTSVLGEFKNHIFCLFRIIHRLITGEEKITDIHNCYFLDIVPDGYKAEIKSVFSAGDYLKVYLKLMDIYSPALDTLAKLKGHDVSGLEILQFILTGEPYDWYKNIADWF
jgi:hypothetical protein